MLPCWPVLHFRNFEKANPVEKVNFFRFDRILWDESPSGILWLLIFVSSDSNVNWSFWLSNAPFPRHGVEHLHRWKKEEKKKTPELLPSADITSPACNKHPSSYYCLVTSRTWFLFISPVQFAVSIRICKISYFLNIICITCLDWYHYRVLIIHLLMQENCVTLIQTMLL